MGSEIEGMESPSEVQRSDGDSMLSIERMVMMERLLEKVPASVLELLQVPFLYLIRLHYAFAYCSRFSVF